MWDDNTQWKVEDGELRRRPGHPGKIEPLFQVVAEKLPWDSLASVAKDLKDHGVRAEGVYLAHDSMGYARYAGRGRIFARLRAHRRAHPDELVYYSFYIVKDKVHEREIETLVIRAAGPQLQFNTNKKRVDIRPGSIRDYEAGTWFYARRRRGRAKPDAFEE